MFENFYSYRSENESHGLMQCVAVYYSGLALVPWALSMGIRFCVILKKLHFANENENFTLHSVDHKCVIPEVSAFRMYRNCILVTQNSFETHAVIICRLFISFMAGISMCLWYLIKQPSMLLIDIQETVLSG
jgi:hypothetical protein